MAKAGTVGATGRSWVGVAAASGIVAALGLVVWGVLLRGQIRGTDASVRAELAEARRRTRELERELEALARRVEGAGARSGEEMDAARGRLEALAGRFSRGIELLGEQAMETEVALGVLRGLIRAGGVIDPSDPGTREALDRLLDKELERRRERYLAEIRGLNGDLRAQWIDEVSRRLGLSDVQREDIMDLYARQTEAWADLYHGVQIGGLEPGAVLEEMNRIRTETSDALTNILGAELTERFRESEDRLFPRSGSPDLSSPWGRRRSQ